MVAQLGTQSFNKVSKTYEKKEIQIIHEYLKNHKEFSKYFDLKKAISYNNEEIGFSYQTATGRIKQQHADAGWIIGKRSQKILGLFESKHQDESPNAIERVNRYLLTFAEIEKRHSYRLTCKNIFLLVSGKPSFIQNSYPHFICEAYEDLGASVLRYVNEIDQTILFSKLSEFFQKILLFEDNILMSDFSGGMLLKAI